MIRLNIVIVAHEFSPSQGSECAVGWNLITNLCKYHNLYVIHATTNQFKTSNYENSIKNYIYINGEIKGLKLISVPQPKTTNFFVKVNSLLKPTNSAIGFAPLYYAGYKAWQKVAYNEASKIIKDYKIDIVHQLTSISFREPGYLWKFDIPFVWGPCSGMVKIPSSFFVSLTFKEICFESIRRFSNYVQSNFSFRIKNATKKAALIYSVTDDDFRYFKLRANCQLKRMLDVGSYDMKPVRTRTILQDNEKLKIIWVGRLVYTKALDLLFKSLSLNNKNINNYVELTIIGDGPLRLKYENLSTELGLTNIVWMGDISHEEVFSTMGKSDILVHTSIKEATSAVVLEALSFGLPVLCHDAFGMSYAINKSCGLKVPFEAPQISIIGFHNAIKELVNDRKLLSKLSEGAIKRSKELSWDKMAETISNDYIKIYEDLKLKNK